MRHALTAAAIAAGMLLTAAAGSGANARRLVLVPLGTFPAATANAEAADFGETSGSASASPHGCRSRSRPATPAATSWSPSGSPRWSQAPTHARFGTKASRCSA